MNICFRVDASTIIGTGHVMRCLTLAEKLRRNGHEVYFICRLHENHLCNVISEKGFIVHQLAKPEADNEISNETRHASWLGVSQRQDALDTHRELLSINLQFDWIIIDHYAIAKTWQREIRKTIPHIMVIDDLADREHDCDVLLDQNYYQNANGRYINLVPKRCKLLLGPKYALLRKEFNKLHNVPKQQKENKSILISYGGSDHTNETEKAINAIKLLKPFKLDVHVVVGASNPFANKIRNLCHQHNYTFHYNINYMARLLHEVDFAICAGGSTTWERYSVGTPAIVTAVAFNQIELCENTTTLGIDRYIGLHTDVKEVDILSAVNDFLNKTNLLLKSQQANKVVDTLGIHRLTKLIK